jgi:Thrombospondin type 3 repeat
MHVQFPLSPRAAACALALIPALAAADSYGPYPAGTTIFVDARNPAMGTGLPDDPYHSIADGIDAAAAGDQVGVAAGNYAGALVMRNGIDVVGWSADTTTIDGLGEISAVICADARIEGFRIRGGGEMQLDCTNGTSPTIAHDIIDGDGASPIVLALSHAVITDNQITGDYAIHGACPCDAIHSYTAAPAIERNYIWADDPGNNISAITLDFTNASYIGARIQDNHIVGKVLVDLTYSGPDGALIVGNLIEFQNGYGENIDIASGQVTATSNTLIGGVGIFLQGSDPVQLYNNNVYHDPFYPGLEDCGAPDNVIAYNNIYPPPPTQRGCQPVIIGENGNISTDPGFVDPGAMDYHLAPGSPLIDAGDSAAPGLPATDYDGLPRVVGAAVDIGAFEFQSADSDGDGIADNADNCIEAANANQRDTDGDGLGNACDPDFNEDCRVNFVDLGVMKTVFFTAGHPDQDLNGDGVVNFLDLAALKLAFFGAPGPSGVPNVCAAARDRAHPFRAPAFIEP